MTPDLIQHAKDALTHPSRKGGLDSNYAYYGDNDEMFGSWGQSGPTRTRDSGALDNSNFQSILGYLQEKYPDDIREMRTSHWAVGWMDVMEVRVLKDSAPESIKEYGMAQYGTIEEDWITDCFKELHEICVDLAESYPIFDESLYSQMEYDDCVEWMKIDGGLTDIEADEVHEILVVKFNHYCSDDSSGYTDDQMKQAKMQLGLLDCEWEGDEDCSDEPATRITVDGYFVCETCARAVGMDPVYPVLEGQAALDV